MHGYLLIFKRFPYIYLNLFSISTTAQRQKKETLNLFNTINVLCWITLLLLLFIFIDKMKLNFPFSVAALFIHINYLFDIQTVCFKLIFGYLKFMKILLVLILVEFFERNFFESQRINEKYDIFLDLRIAFRISFKFIQSDFDKLVNQIQK